MNMTNLFSEISNRLRISRWHRTKKVVIGIAGGISLLLLLIILSNRPATKKTSFSKVSLMPREAAKTKKALNYEFIKFDTLKIPNFAPPQTIVTEQPKQSEQISLTEKKISEPTSSRSVRSTTPKIEAMFPEKQSTFQSSSRSENPNMIVMNNIAKQPLGDDGTTAYVGMQSALVKVILPNRTPVATGSLVEARVLKDASWGNILIPRRAKLIGVASLMNRRINIDFREIIINEVSRSCSGRAYDSKRLLGLPYSPVTSEAKRAILDELRSAVSGVPVVGRMANRTTMTYDYTQDVSVLDEGLEFYVWISSIF